MNTITIRLDDRMAKLLAQASRATRVPQSSLIRQGIDLILLEITQTARFRAARDTVNRRHGKTLRALAK